MCVPFLLPESPKWLLLNHYVSRGQEAKDTLKRFRAGGDSYDASDIIEQEVELSSLSGILQESSTQNLDGVFQDTNDDDDEDDESAISDEEIELCMNAPLDQNSDKNISAHTMETTTSSESSRSSTSHEASQSSFRSFFVTSFQSNCLYKFHFVSDGKTIKWYQCFILLLHNLL